MHTLNRYLALQTPLDTEAFHTRGPRFVKSLFLFSDKQTPQISIKIPIFFFRKRRWDILRKLLNSRKGSISHPSEKKKKKQYSYPFLLSNPFVLKFTHRHGTNTRSPLQGDWNFQSRIPPQKKKKKKLPHQSNRSLTQAHTFPHAPQKYPSASLNFDPSAVKPGKERMVLI